MGRRYRHSKTTGRFRAPTRASFLRDVADGCRAAVLSEFTGTASGSINVDRPRAPRRSPRAL